MAVDSFLTITGLKGESTDSKHPEWIELLSWSHGLSQPVSTQSGTGGRTSERVNISDVSVVKNMDKASPDLALACCNGKHFPEAKIECCEASENKHVYAVITMEDVIISSYQPSGSQGGDKPLESLSLNFGKIKWEYTPLGHDGKPGSKVGPMGWNAEKNEKI
jgi:type VI secretion system secreted protein Hcp